MKKAPKLQERGNSSPAPYSSKQVAFFDLDHTLIKGNCSALFGAYLYKKSLLGFSKAALLVFIYTLHRYKILSLSRLHHWSFRLLFKGKNKALFCSLIKEYVESDFINRVSPLTKQFLEQSRDLGDVYIVSASPDFIVEAYAEKFKVSGFCATEYCANEKGVFTHVGTVLDGHAKWAFAEPLAKGLHSIAFSDDVTDLPLLDNVTVGTLIPRQ